MIIKVEIPDSYTDAALAEYEWLLEWYSESGTPAYYLFTDWENKDQVKTTPINTDCSDIRSLINSEDRNVLLIAEDVAKENIDGFRSLQRSKNVARLSIDGSRERVAIKDSSITYIQSKQRYVIELNVQRKQSDLII